MRKLERSIVSMCSRACGKKLNVAIQASRRSRIRVSLTFREVTRYWPTNRPLRFKDGPSALRRTERLIVVDSIVTRLLDTYISHVVVATGTIVVP